MATIDEVINYNRNSVDWNKFFSVVDTVGNTMNSQKDRFDKSDVFELAIEVFSNGNISYLNKDGVDHQLNNLPNNNGLPTTQEMKFVNNLFYKKYKRGQNGHGPGVHATNLLFDIKLVNSMGENKHTSLPSDYAEFLLVVDSYSVHVVKVSDLVPYLFYKGDGIIAKKIPPTIFSKIIGPNDIKNRQPLTDYNYKAEKQKFQKDFLSKF